MVVHLPILGLLVNMVVWLESRKVLVLLHNDFPGPRLSLYAEIFNSHVLIVEPFIHQVVVLSLQLQIVVVLGNHD